MRGLTDFLITVHVMKGVVGRGPVLFGLATVLAIPRAVVMVLIDGLYPGGVPGFLTKIVGAAVRGLR